MSASHSPDSPIGSQTLLDLLQRQQSLVDQLAAMAQSQSTLIAQGSTDRLLDSAQIRDYRPILTFSAGKRYTHGYRRDRVAAPVVMASATSPAVTALATSAGLPTSIFAAR